MNIEKNIQTVKDIFAAIGRGDKEGLLALVAEDIEWNSGQDWPLAGTHRGHAELAARFRRPPMGWKRRTRRRPNSSRRGKGFWSSVSRPGKSKPRISRSRTTGSSTLLFEIAR